MVRVNGTVREEARYVLTCYTCMRSTVCREGMLGSAPSLHAGVIVINGHRCLGLAETLRLVLLSSYAVCFSAGKEKVGIDKGKLNEKSG